SRPPRLLPELLVILWTRLREQWRQNPGFVTAAAAGSLGLLLTLAIVIQGGIELLDDSTPDDLTEDFAAADLGDPDDGRRADLAGIFDESADGARPPGRLSDNDEPDIDWDSNTPSARQIAASDRYAKSDSDRSDGRRAPVRTRILDEADDNSLDESELE